MARQGTAKQALEAQKQEQINAPAPTTPATQTQVAPAVPNPQDTLTGSGVASDRVKAVVSARTQAPQAPQAPQSVAPPTPAPAPTPTPTPTPQTIQQPAWNYGTAENPVYAQTPQATEAKPAQTQPVTTEVGREQAFGQLAKQPEAQTRQAELKSVRENLKDDSGKQLWDNMKTISASNPNLLQDRNAYNQAFGYDGKDAGEKAMVDSYWRSTRPKSEDIYRSLEAGQGVPQRSLGTSEAVEAIERKSELTKYENLNPYQLSKLIGSELIPGSQVYNDLSAKNPSLITNATKLAQINLPASNQVAPKTNWQEAISQMMQKSPAMQDQMTVEKIMNSDPAISQKTNEVNQYDNQINELTQQQKNLLANITERYKGTGASKATINARYLSESRDLTDQLALLTAQKNSASLALTTLIQNGKDNYEMARQSRLDAEASYYKNMDAMMQMANMGMQQENLEYQRAQQAIERDLQQMQYWQQREDGFVKDELSFERDLYKTKVTQEYQTQMDERNFNQQKELARMGYQNQSNMANLGFDQDVQKMMMQYDMNDAKDQQSFKQDLIKNGKSPAEADALARNASGNWNGANGESLLYAEDGTFIKSTLSQTTNPYGGIECAEYVSRMLGTRVGSTFAEKLKLNDEKTGSIGSIAVWQPAKSGPLATYGHAGIIVGDDGQGNWLIKSANYNLDGRISTDKVPKSAIEGYRTTEINKQQGMAQNQGVQVSQYSDQNVADLAYLTELQDKNPTQAAKEMKELGYTARDLANYKGGNVPLTDKQKQSSQNLANSIKDLLTNYDYTDATGMHFFDEAPRGSDWASAEEKIKTIVANLTLPNLGVLKGPMSDKDLAFMQAASSNLSTNQSDSAFGKQLLDAYNLAARRAGLPPADTLEDIKKGGSQAQPTQGGSTAPSSIPVSAIQDAINRARARQ